MRNVNQASSGAAPDKLILSGEHSVVYGFPAVVSGVNLSIEAKITKKEIEQSDFLLNIIKIFEKHTSVGQESAALELSGNLPIGCGLGSSAAAAAACFGALSNYFGVALDKQKLLTMVQESEGFAHGNPSGVDSVAVVYGGLRKFVKRDGKLTHSPINQSKAMAGKSFFLIQSGAPIESTKDMVERVKRRADTSKFTRKTLGDIGEVTKVIIKNLEEGIFLPQLLFENQLLLDKLGVVGRLARQIVEKVQEFGGSAKITGAGGIDKGSGMILSCFENAQKATNFLSSHNYEFYEVSIG